MKQTIFTFTCIDVETIYSANGVLDVAIDTTLRQVYLQTYIIHDVLSFEDIRFVTLTKEPVAESGKSVVTKLIHRWKKKASIICVTHKRNSKFHQLLLQPLGKARKLHAALLSAAESIRPINFYRQNITECKQKN